mgnify:CR=1 FL=1
MQLNIYADYFQRSLDLRYVRNIDLLLGAGEPEDSSSKTTGVMREEYLRLAHSYKDI